MLDRSLGVTLRACTYLLYTLDEVAVVAVEDHVEVRRVSAAVFGNEKVVEVVLAFDATSEPRAATAQDLSHSTGISYSMVRDVLLRLTAGGVLVALPKVGGRRSPQYYQPAADEGWDNLVRLARWIGQTRTRM